VARDPLILLFAAVTAAAGIFSLKIGGREAAAPPSPSRRLLIGISVGGFEGFIGGLLGVGGGFIVAPILMALGFPTKRAVATTSFIVTFASISGFAAHAAAGRLEVTLTVLTLVAAVAGSQVGSWFMARHAKPGWVKKFYGGLLLAVAAKLAWDLT